MTRRRPPPLPDDFERWRGGVEERLDTLIAVVRDEQIGATKHRDGLREVIGALTQSVQLLSAEMRNMKPLVDDYRDARSEARGAAKLAKVLWVSLGGLAGGAVVGVVELIKALRG